MSRDLYIDVLRCMNIPIYFYLRGFRPPTTDSPLESTVGKNRRRMREGGVCVERFVYRCVVMSDISDNNIAVYFYLRSILTAVCLGGVFTGRQPPFVYRA